MLNGVTRSLCTFEDIRNQESVSWIGLCHFQPSLVSLLLAFVNHVTDRYDFETAGLRHLL